MSRASIQLPGQQRGAALFVAIFLITVVVLAAGLVSLTSVTQHTGQVRAGQADQAWYAALARLESEIPGILANGDCPSPSSQVFAGLQTSLSCEQSEVREGPNTYFVFDLQAQALLPGSIPVRRTARAQIVSGD
ncbi:MAG: hypothetical protein ACXIUB_07380 [Wenzhouxiangella sp.]